MHCPKCGGDTTVIDSMVYEDHVKRRRLCLKCGKRFSTKEILSLPPKKKTLYSYDDGLTWTEKKKESEDI